MSLCTKTPCLHESSSLLATNKSLCCFAFSAVKTLANLLAEHGLPTYHTYAIHDCENENDCAFQVIERIDGINIENFLQAHPEKDATNKSLCCFAFSAVKTLCLTSVSKSK